MKQHQLRYFGHRLKCLAMALTVGVSLSLLTACVSELEDEALRRNTVGMWLDEDTFANISYSITVHFQEDGIMTAVGSIYQNGQLVAAPNAVAIWTVRNGVLRTEYIKEAGDTFPSHSVRYDEIISVTNSEMKVNDMDGNVVTMTRIANSD